MDSDNIREAAFLYGIKCNKHKFSTNKNGKIRLNESLTK